MLHLFRFIRPYTRWGCYDYFRRPANRFYRQLIHPEYLEDHKAAAYDPDKEEELAGLSNTEQERINLVKDAIPYLPGNRQTIMTLYFRYGLSLKEISNRFAAPYQQISLEVQESIPRVKKDDPANKADGTDLPGRFWQFTTLPLE